MTTNKSNPHLAAAVIKQQVANFTPKLGLVLGSGLGDLAQSLKHAIIIPYSDLPGFPNTSVVGHEGQLVAGYLNDLPVICLQGRAHPYENQSYDAVKTYIRTLKLLGCEYFLATNASGSLHFDVGPGELMLIQDHINFQPGNPLAGVNDDEFGPRFLPLDAAYDPQFNSIIKECAQTLSIDLHEGVYIAVLGPSYETAAEIRAFRILGADAVGMSTVPEVIIARHCGLKVAVIATITNYATGLATNSHSHEEVVTVAKKASEKLCQLINSVAKVLRA